MQTLFGKYLLNNPPKESAVYELKFTPGKSIRFDALKGHQREGLRKAERGGFYHKITDQPWIKNRPYTYTLKKPFDCFFVKCKAYVVVWFYKPRKLKRFYRIRITDFLMMETLAKRKSFTEEMVKRYCSDFIDVTTASKEWRVKEIK